MSGALQAVFQNQRSFGAAPGQQAFTTAGNFTWVAPAGVTSVSAIKVGGGGAGASAGITGSFGFGGVINYGNNQTVIPLNSYNLTVGAGRNPNAGTSATASSITGITTSCGGGRAGNGGSGNSGSGNTSTGAGAGGGGGGGVGILAYNTGNNGGNASGSPLGTAGAGGSAAGTGATNGCAGSNPYGPISGCYRGGSGGYGGTYGGGGGASGYGACCTGCGGGGRSGAVRIIWPGTTRSFPSTCTGDL